VPADAPPQMCWLEMLRRPVTPPAKPKPKNPLRNVVLRLDGKQHDLAVGYVAETPLWRPSYRVVVGERGDAELQAWASFRTSRARTGRTSSWCSWRVHRWRFSRPSASPSRRSGLS